MRGEGRRIAQASAWRGFRWDFRGGGSLDGRIFVFAPEPLGRDRIRVPVVRDGRATDLILDARTLARIGKRLRETLGARLKTVVPPPPGMRVETVEEPRDNGVAIA